MCGKLECKKMENVSLTPASDSIIDTLETDPVIVIDTVIKIDSIKLARKKEPIKIKKTFRNVRKVKKTDNKDTIPNKEVKIKKEKRIKSCGCIGKAAPTKTEAQIWALEINKCARRYIRENSNDSLLLYAMDGIRLYENSSLFYLKSLAYFFLENFDYSLTAAEIAKSNNDFWVKEDKKKVYQLIIDNLKAKDYQTPSRYTKQLIIEAQNEYKKIFN